MIIDFKEIDMFQPVKEFLEAEGYLVNAEVKGIDIIATEIENSENIVALELKTSFNLKLLYQAIDRQRVVKVVYMVIPRPIKANDKNFTKIKHIAKKLEIGLITVAMDSSMKMVQICVEAGKSGWKSGKRTARLQKELLGRTVDNNVGGSVRQKILTAFRERCIKLACVLYKNGATSPASLIKDYECPEDTRNILAFNHYGWFEKVKRGIYDLSEEGKKELESGIDFREVFEFYL
jgi:Uncharacterized conserved protein